MSNRIQYNAKGYMNHRIVDTTKGVDLYTFDKVEEVHDVDVTYSTLFDGIEFLEDTLSHCLTDYDGWITYVFIDGYESKVRLGWCGALDGNYKDEYMVLEEDAWRELCKEHKIEVYWVNK